MRLHIKTLVLWSCIASACMACDSQSAHEEEPLDTSAAQDGAFEDTERVGDSSVADSTVGTDTGSNRDMGSVGDAPLNPECETLAGRYFEALERRNACNAPSDCERGSAEICVFGQGCGGVLMGQNTSSTESDALLVEYRSLGCPELDGTCECPAPSPVLGCAQNRCVTCDYTCTMDCVCKRDERGCEIPECEDDACARAEAEIDAALPAVQACSSSDDCSRYEFPICGSAGCFQRAVAISADRTTLDTLVQQAAAVCSGFTCGCGYGDQAICLTGQCRLCPGECDAPCADLEAALIEEIQRVRSCQTDADCTSVPTSFCDVPEFGCYAAAYNGNGFLSGTALKGLIEAYGARNCAKADCDCGPPGPPRCISGICGW